MINKKLGLACYLLLQNRWSWNLLNEYEKKKILDGNFIHNNMRIDYYDPKLYQNGLDFDSTIISRLNERQNLKSFLSRIRPKSVLEIGPGSGYLTRIIVDTPCVKRYAAVDINNRFLQYLNRKISQYKPDLFTEYICGEIAYLHHQFDAVVLASVVHHIPNRVEFFYNIYNRLKLGGSVWASDPTHYLLRIKRIISKILKSDHLNKELLNFYLGTFSSHTMCTLAEYKSLFKNRFEIIKVNFFDKSKLSYKFLQRWMSQQMIIEAIKI